MEGMSEQRVAGARARVLWGGPSAGGTGRRPIASKRDLCILAVLSLALGAAGADIARAEPAEVFLTIDSVSLATPARKTEPLGFIAGRALAHSGSIKLFDVMFLIDVSLSTADSSGVDIDGDGGVARGSGGRGVKLGPISLGGSRGGGSGDSILAAEVAAVGSLLDTFDPRTTRVGIVTFSGSESASSDHAWVEVPLTSEYRKVRAGLEEILLSGSQGGTNMYAGLRLAGIELGGGRSAESTRRSGSQRHIVLLTDGFPTLPGRPHPWRDRSPEAEDRAIVMAKRLGKKRISVHTFAIGRKAAERPRAAVEVAEASGGSFTAVRDPGDLGRLLGEVQFASIEELRIRNLTSGLEAVHQLHNADGTYAALVPVQEGLNTIEVVARSTDGSTERVETTTMFGSIPLTARQGADRARLLEISLARERAKERPAKEVEIEVDGP